MQTGSPYKRSERIESFTFWGLVVIGLIPLIFTKYYLTLDGPAHLYNGNIIKELLLGNHVEFSNLFKFNPLPVPNWISHFTLACLDMVFPDFLSEKIVLGSYLVLFPYFFRKIILWFAPQNTVFSYLGVLFAHNHLFYFGFYNMIIALVAFFATTYYILNYVNKINFRQIAALSLLFLLIYFSHILILMVTILVALLLPLASLKIEKTENRLVVSNWRLFYTKLMVILPATIPAIALAGQYLWNVDSLETAERIDMKMLFNWMIDIRPLLPLCYCADRIYFTHVLSALFLLMIVTNLYFLVKNNCRVSEGKLRIHWPKPTFSIVWALLFMAFTALLFIFTNANLMSERLVILAFIFLCFWLATQTYPRWLHKTAIFIIVVIQVCFSFYFTRAMRQNSRQVELIKEVTLHVEPGSLLLPFNFASNGNWLHTHSPGYLGSGKPIAVIENYEAQLKWFPLTWNMKGPYELGPI
ncbi:MAG TPA: hypothetical protein DCL77_06765, partial [Prolixibacteraceae bacterium]|nr:hypothetical protein [Prolixibacteraceae bacterium]